MEKKKVIAFEPDGENYKLALMNLKENKLENKIVLLNKALALKRVSLAFTNIFIHLMQIH